MKTAKRQIFLYFIFLWLLSGCGQANSAMSPVVANVGDVDREASIVDEVVVEAEIELEGEPAEKQDLCLDCHVDQQRLIDTAKPEEEVVVESEGEG